ncbi:4Fe-4S binding protein [Paenibacillus sp. FSL H7-0942]|uniref:indolepyruvate ferredoxin oxidoreductase subunit alpha n=1 Tax=Paenibacillus TaxID=44249 RepID=UPI0003E20DEA|nr:MULTISPECIES: 4Fe-4S binding protein [Paenibacillus]ETT37501.1 4Fe-4S ferredoxin iron-sulfur binding domain-containing protein [Paenibacillus sp. FSL R5-192]ETT52736.1 4Fe-4S ferredoxin iron-sulfur binding domain-containing protein [Paenibacillus sp. FSL H7-689]MDT9717300.1 4Fe-4S binding protein [Paenibacillus sp. ClWae2A]OMF08225.1 4Fe-4S ferredoxin [Paenibacillus amylolyticus]
MPFVITEHCIHEQAADCLDVCPVDCIVKGEDQYFINPDQCIDCGNCETACPVGAIYYEEDLPDHHQIYVSKALDFFKLS